MRLSFRLKRAVEKFRAMSTVTAFSILDLPDELITLIIEQVPDAETLSKLASTCRHIQGMAEAKLYRSIEIRRGSRAKRILKATNARRERATAIHYLSVPCDSERRQGFGAYGRLLMCAVNLKEFSFESPECSTGDFEDEDTWEEMADLMFTPFTCASLHSIKAGFPEIPLRRLRKCKSTYIIAGRRHVLPLHPLFAAYVYSATRLTDIR